MKRTYKKLNEKGMASIVVVFVIVVLLSLIGVSFTKIMDRALQSTSADQIGTAADYAAQSAINNTIAYLKVTPDAVANTGCKTLLDIGGPLHDVTQLSGNSTTQYTCILTDPNPTDLVYQSLDAYKPQVVPLTTTNTGTHPVSSVMFSWQGANRGLAYSYPAGSSIFDENAWATNNYPPLLRVSFYPIGTAGALGTVESGSKSFFFYPHRGSNVQSVSYSAADGLYPIDCIKGGSISTFIGSPDYDCNVVVNIPSPAAYYIVKITPYFGQASVKIKANNDNGQASKFYFVQAIIDATAKSGAAVKRLQARVDLNNYTNPSGPNDLPDFALRTANTICKRLIIGAGTVNTDATSRSKSASCPNLVTASPLDLSFSASSNPITAGQSTNLNWSATPAAGTSCVTDGGTWGSGTPKANPGSGSTGVLSAGTYTYYLRCNNPGTAPTTIQRSVIITVNPLPADFSISASPSSLTILQGLTDNSIITITPLNGFNSSVTLSGPTGLPAGASSTYVTNPVPGGSGTSKMKITIGGSTSAGTYSLMVTGTGGGKTNSTSVTVTVKVKRTLTLNVIGNGTVFSSSTGQTCGPAATCFITYNDGASDTLSYISGTLIGWGGACSGSARVCNIVMNSDKTVKATFQ